MVSLIITVHHWIIMSVAHGLEATQPKFVYQSLKPYVGELLTADLPRTYSSSSP